MKPVRKMKKKRANKSTSGFTRSPTSSVVTRGKRVKTYGRVTRSKKKQSKVNSEIVLGLRSRKMVSPIPPQFMEPIPPPTLKRYDEESLVGGVVHTVPQPGPSFRPAEDYNFDIVEEQEEEDEYDSAIPVIADVRTLIPLYDLTKDDEEDEDKTRNEEETNEFVANVKPERCAPAPKKGIVRRRSRRPVKDISSGVVRKVNELKTKNDFVRMNFYVFTISLII